MVNLGWAEKVNIRVLDPHKASISRAVVEVKEFASGEKQSTHTDIAGRVSLTVILPVEIVINFNGFEPLVYKLEKPSNEEIVLQLKLPSYNTKLDVVVCDLPSLEVSAGNALEIDRAGARTILDAVEKIVPGAFITRRGVMGYGIATNGTGMVSIRGIGEQPNSAILMVVDGRPDFQGLMGHPLPDFYSLSGTDSVSITQGPGSVLYGSNAMGGVIEVNPSRPQEKMTTRISTSFGSYSSGQHSLFNGAKVGAASYSVALGYDHTRGDRDRSAFRAEDGAFTFGYDFSSSWKTSVQGRYGHFYVEDPGPTISPLSNSSAQVGRGGFSFAVDNVLPRTWGYARVYSSYGKNIISNGFCSNDNAKGVRIQQSFMLTPRLTLEGGTDVVTYGGIAQDYKLNYGEHHIADAAGFSRVQWAPYDFLRFNTGIRYDHNSLHGGILVPEFGATYFLKQNWSITAAVGKGFRNPTIRELFLFPAPNPFLMPEKLWNYQLSLQTTLRPNLVCWVTGYYADLSNLIITTGRYPNLSLSNAGNAVNRGIEGNVSWKLSKHIAFSSGYALVRSNNLGPSIPQHKYNYSMDLSVKRAFVHIGGSAVSPMWADIRHVRKLGGYNLTSIKCILPIKTHYNFFTMVDNLFNHRYEVLADYPMPGINFMSGMNLNF